MGTIGNRVQAEETENRREKHRTLGEEENRPGVHLQGDRTVQDS